MSDGDTVWRRDETASPCVRVCVLHPDSGLCLGCKRTGEEIAAWSRLSPEDRARINAELGDRTVPVQRRGGAGARRGRG